MGFGFDQMQCGLVSWAVQPDLKTENIDKTFSGISEIVEASGIKKKTGGKPVVEIFAGDDLKFAELVRAEADRYGLDIVCCGFIPGGSKAHLVSDDESERAVAIQKIKSFIDYVTIAAGDNPRILSGPWYCEHKRNVGRAFKNHELYRLVDVLKEITNYAKGKDVYLAMEILNSKETNVLNTFERAWDLVTYDVRCATHCKHLGVHMDTIHQYREEGRTPGDTSEGHLQAIIPSLEEALYRNAMYHLHLSENPRLQWGTGNIGPLTGQIIQTLQKGKYKGAVVVECFHPSMDEMVEIKGRPVDQMDAKFVAIRSLAYVADNIR